MGLFRDNKFESNYYIPETKNEYLDILNKMDFSSLVPNILNYCKNNKINNICSLGSGRCGLEYHLMLNSNIKITVTDSSKSISKINDFNIFQEAFLFNPLEDDFTNLNIKNNTLLLLCRVDTEFDDDSFRNLFELSYNNNVNHICVIPAELLSYKILLSELYVRIKSLITKKKLVFCGFARSKNEFIKSWKNRYKLNKQCSNKNIFFLN